MFNEEVEADLSRPSPHPVWETGNNQPAIDTNTTIATSKDSQHEQEGSSPRKGTIYELFVLGELIEVPHHGYLLRDILSRLLGPFRHISWGVLYPLIRQLEQDQLIEPNEAEDTRLPDKQGDSKLESKPSSKPISKPSSKQRKSYRITERGKKRFHQLMHEEAEYTSDYPELFIVKLNNFDNISLEQQPAVLWHYHGYLQDAHFYIQRGQEHATHSSDIPDNQRAHILRTISYRASGIQGELTWLDQEIARLEDELERIETN